MGLKVVSVFLLTYHMSAYVCRQSGNQVSFFAFGEPLVYDDELGHSFAKTMSATESYCCQGMSGQATNMRTRDVPRVAHFRGRIARGYSMACSSIMFIVRMEPHTVQAVLPHASADSINCPKNRKTPVYSHLALWSILIERVYCV